MINRYDPSQEGIQPIRALYHNVIDQFEKTNPDFLELTRNLIKTIGLKPGIVYLINDKPIFYYDEDGNFQNQTPFISYDKQITLHETFQSYIWCIAYALTTAYEEAIAKPFNFRAEVNIKKVELSDTMFRYATTLIENFVEWDKRLPNPELYSEQNQVWIEMIDNVYLHAVNWILCHEFAHAEKGHLEQYNPFETNEETLRQELEADTRATELMLYKRPQDIEATSNIGIVVGLCSLIFLSSEIKSDTHPHNDNRLDGFLRTIDPPRESAMWGVACVAYRFWDKQYRKNFMWPKAVSDMKSMYENIKLEIETRKRN